MSRDKSEWNIIRYIAKRNGQQKFNEVQRKAFVLFNYSRSSEVGFSTYGENGARFIINTMSYILTEKNTSKENITANGYRK